LFPGLLVPGLLFPGLLFPDFCSRTFVPGLLFPDFCSKDFSSQTYFCSMAYFWSLGNFWWPDFCFPDFCSQDFSSHQHILPMAASFFQTSQAPLVCWRPSSQLAIRARVCRSSSFKRPTSTEAAWAAEAEAEAAAWFWWPLLEDVRSKRPSWLPDDRKFWKLKKMWDEIVWNYSQF
jgi:hypothetical protein